MKNPNFTKSHRIQPLFVGFFLQQYSLDSAGVFSESRERTEKVAIGEKSLKDISRKELSRKYLKRGDYVANPLPGIILIILPTVKCSYSFLRSASFLISRVPKMASREGSKSLSVKRPVSTLKLKAQFDFSNTFSCDE